VVKVSTSILDPDALASWAIEAYDLSFPARCRIVSIGVNDVYHLLTRSGFYFLRVSPHGWRTREQIQGELEFIEELNDSGVPAARAARMTSGDTIASLEAPEGERLVVMFETAPGSDVRDIDLTQTRSYGRLAARLHKVAEAMPVQPERFTLDEQWLLLEPLQAIHERFPGSPDIARLEPLLARIVRTLEELPRDSPRFGLCHGDLHPGNLRIAESGVQTLFDFDFCGYGWRMYDLTVFLWNSFGERRPKRWRNEHWRAFLGGYRDWRPLDDDTLELVPFFLVARQIWLMGLDCRIRSGWPPQWLSDGWIRDSLLPIHRWIEDYPILR
jgi:Ser/Thr protein kinase RdoA (MazF antagonist)